MCISEPRLFHFPGVVLAQLKVSFILLVLYFIKLLATKPLASLFTAVYHIPPFYTFPLPPFPDSRPFPHKKQTMETPGEGTRRGLCVLIGARKGGSRSGPSGRGTEERSVNLVKGGRDLHERGRLRQVEAKDGP